MLFWELEALQCYDNEKTSEALKIIRKNYWREIGVTEALRVLEYFVADRALHRKAAAASEVRDPLNRFIQACRGLSELERNWHGK